MAITTANLRIRRSTTSGSAGNSLTQANPQLSLGKYLSITDLPGTKHGMFTLMSFPDNAGAVSQFSCHFAVNLDGGQDWTDVRVYLNGGDPAGGALVALAVDTTAASAIGSASAQALTAASLTAPGAGVTGLSWSSPTTWASGIQLGTIPTGYCRAFWTRRTGNNSPNVTGEAITIAILGGTLA